MSDTKFLVDAEGTYCPEPQGQPEQPFVISFHMNGQLVGRLTWTQASGLSFEGEADTAAKRFFAALSGELERHLPRAR